MSIYMGLIFQEFFLVSKIWLPEVTEFYMTVYMIRGKHVQSNLK